MYRQFDALHKWMVANVQGGKDDGELMLRKIYGWVLYPPMMLVK